MNSRHDRTIRVTVASGSLIAILAIGIPWADEYISLGRDASELTEMQAELAAAEEREAQLDQLDAKLSGQLIAMTNRSIDPDQTTQVRDTLITIIRDGGARLRNLDVSNGESRVWAMEGDDPRAATMPPYAEESEFELLTHTVDLRADGSLESVQKVLGDIINQGWLMTTTNMKIMPTGVRESPISIELRITLYGLRLRPEDELGQDLAAWPNGTSLR